MRTQIMRLGARNGEAGARFRPSQKLCRIRRKTLKRSIERRIMMRYKIWTGTGDTFDEVRDRIEEFLNAHPAIQITETKIFQSNGGTYNAAIIYKISESSTVPLRVIIRALNKYTSNNGEEFNIVSDKIDVENVVLYLPTDEENAKLFRLIREEKYWKERIEN